MTLSFEYIYLKNSLAISILEKEQVPRLVNLSVFNICGRNMDLGFLSEYSHVSIRREYIIETK